MTLINLNNWRQSKCYWLILLSSIIICQPVHGEIVPDSTLGAEASNIINLPIGNNSIDLIDGGALRGNNLFHSFTQFNVNEGQNVYFTNPIGVRNILTRVTGGSTSNILGTLGVAGTANLFLVNPSGIIFGKNAALDIQGSFVGTTANAVKFGMLGFFSATSPETPGLLSINPSALLFNQINPTGAIINQGTLINQGASLMLVSSNVKLDEGKLFSQAGRIEIGAFESGSIGFSNDTFQLDISQDALRGDVFITNNSQVKLNSNNQGNISIYARNLDISSNSFVVAEIPEGLDSGNNQGGKIDINAIGSVTLNNGAIANIIGGQLGSTTTGNGGDININANLLSLNQDSLISSVVLGKGNAGDININTTDTIDLSNGRISSYLFGATGQAGNVNINTGSVLVRNGSSIGSLPFATQGSSGNVNINARDNVIVDGESVDGVASSILSTNILSQGKGGDININTTFLSVINGGGILSGNSLGVGDGGNIYINARDSVVFDGVGNYIVSNNNGFILRNRSSADASVTEQAEGKGGNLNINTGSLLVKNGAILNTSTGGKGDAGNITINATGQVIFDGQSQYEDRSAAASAVLSTGTGKGGNITITSDSLAIKNTAGISSSTLGRGGNAGDITIKTRGQVNFTNIGSLSTTTYGEGDAGKVTINSGGTVFLDESSAILAGAFSIGGDVVNAAKQRGFTNIDFTGLDRLENSFTANVGSANNVEINADTLKIDNKSFIGTFTSSGNGGNIRLNIRDILLLRRGGGISTEAGVLELGGNGGNITIKTPFLVAVPNEDSDIAANAYKGNGGNINIETQGIFGISPNTVPTSQSNITASSRLGVQGQVLITEPDTQPTKGIIELPEQVLDATSQIAQICPRGNNTATKPLGEFTITGRGSFPPSPLEPLPGTTTTTALLQAPPTQANNMRLLDMGTPPQIIEAQTWVKGADGNVMLVAKAPIPKATSTINTCPQ